MDFGNRFSSDLWTPFADEMAKGTAPFKRSNEYTHTPFVLSIFGLSLQEGAQLV
jgi:hypothetical protein